MKWSVKWRREGGEGGKKRYQGLHYEQRRKTENARERWIRWNRNHKIDI